MKHDNIFDGKVGGADVEYSERWEPFYAKYDCYPTTHELVDELLRRLPSLEEFLRDEVLINGTSSTLPSTLREDTASCLMEIGHLLEIYARRKTNELKLASLSAKRNPSGWKPGYVATPAGPQRLAIDLANELEAHLVLADGNPDLLTKESLDITQQLVDNVIASAQ